MEECRQDIVWQVVLDYYEFFCFGKLEVWVIKLFVNGCDLFCVYFFGVVEVCLEIKVDLVMVVCYILCGNFVVVVLNGMVVLGLGNIGVLVLKLVMEGKVVLFKKFVNIDCFDIELDQFDLEKLVEIVCVLEFSFGVINLEDIKVFDCFIVEKICCEWMNILVFYDDQYGIVIVVGVVVMNVLLIVQKKFEDIKVVLIGGGVVGIVCLNMLLKLGVKWENVWLCDIVGLVY